MNDEKVDSCTVIVKDTDSEQVDWGKLVGKLKPGSHLAAICPLLNHHSITMAIEDCGIEIRDCIMVLGKPSYMVTLGRVPLEGTVAGNVLKHGVGAINIDRCRILGKPWKAHSATGLGSVKFFTEGDTPVIDKVPHDLGRWPANVIIQGDESIRAKSPFSKSCTSPSLAKPKSKYRPGQGNYQPQGRIYPGDSGSAARFFHSVPCEDSLKDLTLYLTKLITPSEGKVLVYDLPQSAIIALKGMGFVTCEYGENEI